MPELSRFFGIRIAMQYFDHAPPHFHVRYGDERAVVALKPLRLLDGHLSPRVLGLVMEWAALHAQELQFNWDRARQGRPLLAIEPLQ